MKTNDNTKVVTNAAYHRSYFDWGRYMQVVRKGKGEIAMTESELVKFFGVTWRKPNHKLQTIMKFPNLHPDERDASQEEVINDRECVRYASLYPLSTIIALSFLLDSMEAHLFRKYVCRRLQKPITTVTPIILLGKTDN